MEHELFINQRENLSCKFNPFLKTQDTLDFVSNFPE